jgi:acid-sensing ion channel, other
MPFAKIFHSIKAGGKAYFPFSLHSAVMAKIKPLIPDNLTIHGVSYIADVKSSKLTKVFWIFVMILSLVCFIFCAIKLCFGYIQPDIAIQVSDIKADTLPFPAITICPQTKFNENSFNLSQLFINACKGNLNFTSDDEQKFFEMAMQVCPGTKNSLNVMLNMEMFISHAKLAGNEIIDALYDVLDLETRVYFDQRETEVETVFSDDGICFSFNIDDYSAVFKNDVLHEDFDKFKWE